MDSQEFNKNMCRACLDDRVVLDWHATLYGYCDITYKECFYKYTQLECIEPDPFPPMLCQACLESLYNTHTFALKALESHGYFEDHFTKLEEDIKYSPTEFETVLVEKIEVEPVIQDHFVYVQSDDEVIIKPVENEADICSKRCRTGSTKRTEKQKKYKTKIKISAKVENKTKEHLIGSDAKSNIFEYNFAQFLNESDTKTQRKHTGRKTRYDAISEKNTEDKGEQIKELEDQFLDDKSYGGQSELKVKKRYKEKKRPRMCSICSKILHNKHAVQMHEKTHMENRERKETCKVCGLKFYDKPNLYSHSRIHKENREKNHKCEFCDKSFYNKGGLNIHRRIHLGQMIPCSLCPKQYFRQIDLDRHMSSHSATAINSELKKRSRYFVRCKYCDKSILSTSFKSHTAAHLNEPLMKCSICSKEFYRRESCVLHVKKIHKKTNEEYNNFIITYTKNRISHLFLEQKADIQFTDE